MNNNCKIFDFDSVYVNSSESKKKDITSYNLENVIVKNKSTDKAGSSIDAGYTYFGQLIAHDIVNNSRVGRKGITSILNLDSIYGDKNFNQKYIIFLDNGKFVLGYATGDNGKEIPESDLFRDKSGKALIPEPRNDENIFIAQMHLLWQKFHNKIIDYLILEKNKTNEIAGLNNKLIAMKYVIDIFHKIIVNDYLCDILHPKIRDLLVNKNFRINEMKYNNCIPLEFSHAAFRFGHSMVRESYRLNEFDSKTNVSELISGDESEFLQKKHIIVWDIFFKYKFNKCKPKSLFDEYTNKIRNLDFEIINKIKNSNFINNLKNKTKKLIPGIFEPNANCSVQSAFSIDTKIIDEMINVPIEDACHVKDIRALNISANFSANIMTGNQILEHILLNQNKYVDLYNIIQSEKNIYDDLKNDKLLLWPFILKEAELSTNRTPANIMSVFLNKTNGLGIIGSLIVGEVLLSSINLYKNKSKIDTKLNKQIEKFIKNRLLNNREEDDLQMIDIVKFTNNYKCGEK